MKSRRNWGEFKLEQADIESYCALKETAGEIGKRRGGFSSSNVLYHLRKVDTPEMREALAYWANMASDDYKRHRKEKVLELVKAGWSTSSIVEEVGTSTSTVTKARRELGLSGPVRPKKIKPAVDGCMDFTLRNVVNTLVSDVKELPHFVALTKKWPVNISLAG
ncbi:MAG: helix-turn-helix domain containing protein [Tolumonas sp.]|nr:helix-turn-helix domain containing protein [Tolumonas sp.]